MKTELLTQFIETTIPTIDTALERYLTFNCEDQRQTLEDAMKYSALAPSKKIRPLLVIAVAQLFQKDTDPVLPLASAIEMIHTYSLIHDDLPAMDDDTYRRGQLTCHKQYDEATAILAGDTLNSYAFELLAEELPHHFKADNVLKCIQLLAKSFGIHGMAGGQLLDLYAPNITPSQTLLESIHAKKTGALITSCFTSVACLYNATPNDFQQLEEIGQKMGLLFQVVDDILDITGTQETLGKTPQKDLEQNKLTYPALYGLDVSKKIAETLQEEIQEALHTIPQYHTESHPQILLDMIDYLTKRTS